MNTSSELQIISKIIERLYLYTLESSQNVGYSGKAKIILLTPEIYQPRGPQNELCYYPESGVVHVHPSWGNLRGVLYNIREKYLQYRDKMRLNQIILPPNSPCVYDYNHQVSLFRLKYYAILQYNILKRVQRCLEIIHPEWST